jgi:hypothetical protein
MNFVLRHVDMTHRQVIDLVLEWLRKEGLRPVSTPRIGERAIPDVLVKHHDGKIVIIECKQDYRPNDVARSINKYASFCDRLYLAMTMQHAYDMVERLNGLQTSFSRTDYGVIAVHPDQVGVLKVAPDLRFKEKLREQVDRALSERLDRLRVK